MDDFDPFFTPDPPQNTSTSTPLTPTTPSHSAQQDLLDIFGGGDLFPPSPTSPQPSSSDQSVRGEPSAVCGGGGGDLDFFGLMDATSQDTSSSQAGGGWNSDPFGLVSFGEGSQNTNQDFLNPDLSSESHNTSDHLTQEPGVGSKPQFDESLDVFFGDFSQKTDLEPGTKQGACTDFQDLFFSDAENQKPDPDQKGGGTNEESADLLVNDDVEDKIIQASDVENIAQCDEPPDSQVTADQNTDHESAVGKQLTFKELDSSPQSQVSLLETEDPNLQKTTEFNAAFSSGLFAQTVDSAKNPEDYDPPKTVENPSALTTQNTSHLASINPAVEMNSDSDMKMTTTPAMSVTDKNEAWNMDNTGARQFQATPTTQRAGQADESQLLSETAGNQGTSEADIPWIDEDEETLTGNDTSAVETINIHLKKGTEDQVTPRGCLPSSPTADDTNSQMTSHDSEEASKSEDQGWQDSLTPQLGHDHSDGVVSGDAVHKTDHTMVFSETETSRMQSMKKSDVKAWADSKEISLPTQGGGGWELKDDKEHDRQQPKAGDREDDRQPFTENREGGRYEVIADDVGDVRDKAVTPLQPQSEFVKPSEAPSQCQLLSSSGDATLAATGGGKRIPQTGSGQSTGEIEDRMDAKGETHGGRGPASFSDLLNDFGDTTLTKGRPQTLAEDSGEASDDLRLDDFIGVSEIENEPLGRKSSITSSGSRRHKKLRKKKQASPMIVVQGVEEDGAVKEGGGGGGGEEEEEEEMDWKEKSESRREESKMDNSDTEMDFDVLEVVSSHLNLEVSKQKTSLRKRGSLARRKRPTRNTVAIPAGSSDTFFADITDHMSVTSSAKHDLADDEDLDKQTSSESSGNTVTAQKKFVPMKPPVIVPGLQDLTQSKLFKKERKKTAEDFPPAAAKPSSSRGGLMPADSRPWQSTGNLVDSDLSTPKTSTPSQASLKPGSTPENGAQSTPERKTQYKSPVWLSEMKAKSTSPSRESSTTQNHTRKETGALSNSNTASSVQKVESSRREGLRGQGVSPEATVKKREQPEAEKPMWMRTALEKTSRVAGKLQGQKEGDENRTKDDDDDDQRTAPPWAAELKRKKLPLGVAGQTPANNQNERAETPSKQNTATRERDVYTPSWAKRGSPQLNSTTTSSPRNSGPAKATNGNASDVRGTTGTPTQTNEMPRWKIELAEKKRRQAEKDKDNVSSDRSPGGDALSATTDSSSPSPTSLPAWKQQLKARKKPSTSATDSDSEEDEEKRSGDRGEGGGSPDWIRQAEERRKRLFKSGLLDKGANETDC